MSLTIILLGIIDQRFRGNRGEPLCVASAHFLRFGVVYASGSNYLRLIRGIGSDTLIILRLSVSYSSQASLVWLSVLLALYEGVARGYAQKLCIPP